MKWKFKNEELPSNAIATRLRAGSLRNVLTITYTLLDNSGPYTCIGKEFFAFEAEGFLMVRGKHKKVKNIGIEILW